MTKLIFLLGNPIDHSISPGFWNETFNSLGIDAYYIAVNISEDKVDKALKGIEAFDAIGANVTIPYKQIIARECSILHEAAETTKVVNTIKFCSSGFEGWNTDYSALLSIFEEFKDIHKALIIGDGASSKTTLEVLEKCNCNNILQIARKFGKTEVINKEQKNLTKLVWNEKNFVHSVQESDIIINTTPIGWNSEDVIPGFSDSLNKDKIFLDFNYSNVSKLIKAANEKKCKVINGLELLLRQALDSFKIFFNDEPPEDIMRKAVYKHFC